MLQVSTHRKHYNSLINRLESRDIERNNIENEVKELYNHQSELIEKLDRFRLSIKLIFSIDIYSTIDYSVIKKKEDRIGAYDAKIHCLQQRILHVEKRKYVLDYKTKSLLERIEPIDQEIIRLKANNKNLYL